MRQSIVPAFIRWRLAAARRMRWGVRLALLGAFGCAAAAEALPTIDQSNVAFNPTLYLNVSSFSPIGQEFVPVLDSIDSVQLLICCRAQETPYVRIREGSILGPILGTSSLALPSPSLLVTFRFAAPIALVPDDVYVIEVVNDGGIESMIGVGDPIPMPESVYPRGRLILDGQPDLDGLDLWFQEGLGIPEPATGVLIGIGLAVLRSTARTRPRTRRPRAW